MPDTVMTTESTAYVTYIAGTPDKVWAALTSSEFTTQYFFGRTIESDWRTGSPWLLRKPDGSTDVGGVVRISEPLRRLELTWVVAWMDLPEAIVRYDIEDLGGVVRLSTTESHPTPIPAHLLEGGRRGWPMILSGLKTLLETGKPLGIPTPQPPKG